MQLVINSSNLRATVAWLMQNEDHFRDLDPVQAQAEVSRLVKRAMASKTIADADTDDLHEIVWAGVMAVVSAGTALGWADNQREVTLYCAHTDSGPKDLQKLY